MANNEKRSCLRGLESAIFDLVGTGAATEQWVEWLKVPLQHAEAVGDLSLVMKLQEAGANGSGLHAALEGGQAALSRDLAKRGESVNGKDENGDSPLHLAAALGDEETVSLLLEKGARPNALDRAGRAPLHVAASKGHLAVVDVLLAGGANPSSRFRQEYDTSVLGLAAAKGRVDIVIAHIRSGVYVNATGCTGSTTLHTAAYCNEVGVIDVLVKAGADVNVADDRRGWVPLHCASGKCCFEAIVYLLKNGARVGELDKDGQSPLHLTSAQGHLPATKALLDAGADVNAIDFAGRTALQFAVAGGHADVSQFLVQAGANVNRTDSRGCTLLHQLALFCVNADPTVVRGLIEAGATVDAPDRFGETPLHCCLFVFNGLEAMAVLLECGANPNAPNPNGDFPLHLTTKVFSIEDAGKAVDLLLRSGVDETAVNGDGQTPLEAAEDIFGVDNLGRVRDLLTQAPVDRNWRRRGWLLLCRAYPRRMRLIPGTGVSPSDRAKKCRAGLVSIEVAGGPSVVLGEVAGGVAAEGGGVRGDWSGVVTWVVAMELEGIFRNVVEYL